MPRWLRLLKPMISNTPSSIDGAGLLNGGPCSLRFHMAWRLLILPPPKDCRFNSAIHCSPGGNSSSSQAKALRGLVGLYGGVEEDDADDGEDDDDDDDDDGEDGRTTCTVSTGPSSTLADEQGSQTPLQMP